MNLNSDQHPDLAEAICILAAYFPQTVPLPVVEDRPNPGVWLVPWRKNRCMLVGSCTHVECNRRR